MNLAAQIESHIANSETPEESASAFAGLDALLESIRERSEAFERQLDAEPQIRPCHVTEHGFSNLNREASFAAAKPVYTCAVCEHEAFLARAAKRIEAAGIPADVRHATIGNFRTDRTGVKTGDGLVGPAKFVEKAEIFAAGGLRNLVLAGSPGIGKGHLAAALCIQAIFKGQSVKWAECARLFSEYHRAYSKDATEPVIEAHARPALLVLDEICLRDLPADGEEILFAILDRRQKAGRRTILLGNHPAVTAKAWLGARICDRLRSGGIAFCYGEWESMRGTQQDGAGDTEF